MRTCTSASVRTRARAASRSRVPRLFRVERCRSSPLGPDSPRLFSLGDVPRGCDAVVAFPLFLLGNSLGPRASRCCVLSCCGLCRAGARAGLGCGASVPRGRGSSARRGGRSCGAALCAGVCACVVRSGRVVCLVGVCRGASSRCVISSYVLFARCHVFRTCCSRLRFGRFLMVKRRVEVWAGV